MLLSSLHETATGTGFGHPSDNILPKFWTVFFIFIPDSEGVSNPSSVSVLNVNIHDSAIRRGLKKCGVSRPG